MSGMLEADLVLHTVVERQRREMETQRELIRRQRATLAQHSTKIHAQEETILEQQAQLQAQAAELRALRRQHSQDQELVRDLQDTQALPPSSLARKSPAASRTPPAARIGGSSSQQLTSPRTPSTRQQLQQALADKAVLVASLHRLVNEVARARVEAHSQAAASERTLAAAWRLGELGQAGIALVNEVGSAEPSPRAAARGGGSPRRGGRTAAHDGYWERSRSAPPRRVRSGWS